MRWYFSLQTAKSGKSAFQVIARGRFCFTEKFDLLNFFQINKIIAKVCKITPYPKSIQLKRYSRFFPILTWKSWNEKQAKHFSFFLFKTKFFGEIATSNCNTICSRDLPPETRNINKIFPKLYRILLSDKDLGVTLLIWVKFVFAFEITNLWKWSWEVTSE